MSMIEERKTEIIIAVVLLGGIMAWLILPISFQADTIILQTPSGTTSCVQDFVLAQNLTDLCDVVIITPINNQLLQYNGTFWVNANVSSSDDTICANVGGGAQVFKDGECNFRTLVGSPDISIVQNLNEIVIDFNGTSGGDTTACINVGTGTGYSCVEGTNVNLRSLLAGTGISITNNTNTVTITNTGIISCFNVGSGFVLLNEIGNICAFDSLIAGDGITITDTTDDLTFISTCENTGTGEAICEANNNINSLIAGSGISITDTTGDLTVNNTSPDLEVDQIVHINLSTNTMTNIGTSYVDIYTAVFSSEHLFNIDCNNISDLRIYFAWDYVGTGTHQTRWVDVADNNNVLYESTGFTTDQDVYDSGWFTKPAWCTGTYQIEQQGKSTVATDDPIARIYAVHVR